MLMRRYRWALLAGAVGIAVGCSSEPPPPPEMTEELQKEIDKEDARVREEELRQSESK